MTWLVFEKSVRQQLIQLEADFNNISLLNFISFHRCCAYSDSVSLLTLHIVSSSLQSEIFSGQQFSNDTCQSNDGQQTPLLPRVLRILYDKYMNCKRMIWLLVFAHSPYICCGGVALFTRHDNTSVKKG